MVSLCFIIDLFPFTLSPLSFFFWDLYISTDGLLIYLFMPPFLLQVEVPPPVISGALLEGVVATQPSAALGVENEPPSGGMAKEDKQVVKDAESVLAFASLVIQDPKASPSPIP